MIDTTLETCSRCTFWAGGNRYMKVCGNDESPHHRTFRVRGDDACQEFVLADEFRELADYQSERDTAQRAGEVC